MSQSRKKRVLIVAFFFPPSNVVGAIRPAMFAKYLPDHGWEPTVLTVDAFRTRPNTTAVELPPESVVQARYLDPVGLAIRMARGPGALLGALPGAPRLQGASAPRNLATRLRGSWLGSLPGLDVLRFPDRALPWFLPAFRQGLRVLGRQRFDAIYSTSPPPTAHLVAAALSASTGVDWYADLRDLWTGNPNLHRGSLWQFAEEALERRVLGQARGLITVSDPLATSVSALHGRPASVICNGFDPPAEPLARSGWIRNERLTIVYTGSIYPDHQDPSPLFGAIAQLHGRGAVTPDQLRVRFYGEGDLLAPRIDAYGVRPYVESYPWVEHDEAIRLQREASVLLLLDWTDPAQLGIYSAKVFEYLNAGRPILAVGSHGGTVVDGLLRRCQAGTLETSVSSIAVRLEQWLAEHRRSGRVAHRPDAEAIGEYSYPRLTSRLASVLDGGEVT
jgi:glycosyltransferase involved in cell wall biosynthesis